jgi:hypothetical protein
MTLIFLPAATVYVVLTNDRMEMWLRIAAATASALLGSVAVYQLDQEPRVIGLEGAGCC